MCWYCVCLLNIHIHIFSFTQFITFLNHNFILLLILYCSFRYFFISHICFNEAKCHSHQTGSWCLNNLIPAGSFLLDCCQCNQWRLYAATYLFMCSCWYPLIACQPERTDYWREPSLSSNRLRKTSNFSNSPGSDYQEDLTCTMHQRSVHFRKDFTFISF